jgi:hypothetical protein
MEAQARWQAMMVVAAGFQIFQDTYRESHHRGGFSEWVDAPGARSRSIDQMAIDQAVFAFAASVFPPQYLLIFQQSTGSPGVHTKLSGHRRHCLESPGRKFLLKWLYQSVIDEAPSPMVRHKVQECNFEKLNLFSFGDGSVLK